MYTYIYTLGTTLPTARVLGYHLVESEVVASATRNLIQDDSVTHISHIKIGDIYNATIYNIVEAGIQVKIQNRIRAFCPYIHTTDTITTKNNNITKLNSKFKIGQIIKIRIWQIKNDNNIIVTHKKSLLDECVDNIYTYDDITVGKCSIGLVTYVDITKGLTIHFYNGIRGVIPIHILYRQGVNEIVKSYRIGQVIKCIFLAKFHPKDVPYYKVYINMIVYYMYICMCICIYMYVLYVL